MEESLLDLLFEDTTEELWMDVQHIQSEPSFWDRFWWTGRTHL